MPPSYTAQCSVNQYSVKTKYGSLFSSGSEVIRPLGNAVEAGLEKSCVHCNTGLMKSRRKESRKGVCKWTASESLCYSERAFKRISTQRGKISRMAAQIALEDTAKADVSCSILMKINSNKHVGDIGLRKCTVQNSRTVYL
jgi:hypothetical protein